MDEDWWQELVELVLSGRVIAVVGPELLATADPKEAATQSLEAMLAERFAESLNVSLPAGNLRVRDVASEYLRNKGSRRRLQPKMSRVIRELEVTLPAHDLLAQITELQLLVSVTPDRLLQRALDRTRYAGRAETQAVFNAINLQSRDLPVDLRDTDASVVFYPFGSEEEDDYAITEEDVLEFLFRLVGPTVALRHLFAAINRSHLLFIGCNYPDWLTRFWIRALTGDRLRLNRDELYVIADQCARQDTSLALFLNRTSIRLFEGDAEQFVSRLHADVTRLRPKASSRPQPRPAHTVFISYSAATDRDAAVEINNRLLAVGLKTWFDKDEIAYGQGVEDELRRNIESSNIFVPVVSRKALARNDKPYFRLEWALALKVARRESPDAPFIFPVFIDDVPKGSAEVPQEFWDRVGERIEHAWGGAVSTRFAEALRDQVREMAVRKALAG